MKRALKNFVESVFWFCVLMVVQYGAPDPRKRGYQGKKP